MNLIQNFFSHKTRRRAAPYLFLLPFIVLFTTFWAGPIISSMYLSLTRWNGLRPPQFIGFENYARLFSDPVFQKALQNTLIGAVVYDVLLVLMALALALVLHLPFLRWKSFFRGVSILPVTMSLAVVAFVFQLIYSAQGGLLNQLLGLVGAPPRNWLGDPNIALGSIIGLRLWRAVGYYAIILLAGLQNIPEELSEAAWIDGANWFQTTWHVTIPLLRPVLAFVIVTSTIWALQLFDEPWLLTQGGPLDATKTVVIYLYQNSFRFLTLGYGAAISYILTLVIIAISVIQLRLTMTRD